MKCVVGRVIDELIVAYDRELHERMVFFWRLEFQKRGAPHLHLLVHVPGPIPDRDAFLKGFNNRFVHHWWKESGL